jgi:hypothetical protein
VFAVLAVVGCAKARPVTPPDMALPNPVALPHLPLPNSESVTGGCLVAEDGSISCAVADAAIGIVPRMRRE